MSADRFYGGQKMTKTSMQTNTGANKPKRRLKKDIVLDIEKMLSKEIPGLDKLTIVGLLALEDALIGELS